METNRLRFVDLDESFGIKEVAPITGFTVLKAPRGTTEPIFFPKGSQRDIISRIGAPHKNYPGIQEALDYNAEYNLWISAPPGIKAGQRNYYGGVYVTTRGSLEAFYQVEDPELPSFVAQFVAGNTVSPYSKNSSLSVSGSGLLVDNIPIMTTAAVSGIHIFYPALSGDSTTVINLTCEAGSIKLDALEVGTISGDSIIIDGDATVPELDFTNTALVNHLSLNLNKVNVLWDMNIENDVIMTLYQTSPRASKTYFRLVNVDTSTVLDGMTNPLYNTMTFSIREDLGISTYQSSSITVSPVYGAVNGQGAALYVEDVLDGNFYIKGKSYKTFADSAEGTVWPTYTTSYRETGSMGYRILVGNTLTSEELSASLMEGWTAVSSNTELAAVSLFMNIENTFEALATFSSLRHSTHSFSTFVSGLKVSSSSAAAAVTALKACSIPKTTGLAVYCNEFLVRESYYGTDYWTIPIGSIGVMLSRIMNLKLGGWAPMYTNTGDGLGGQLSKAVKKQKYTFTADQLDELDAASINPIIYDINYGLMITSQKTCQSPQVLTDWSYIGHQMAFDLFKKEIKTAVMIPQIGKPINGFYMDLRKQQAENILNQRLVGAKAIWADGVVLVHEVNTTETKAANKFVIKIRVKVNPFAEAVELVFNNVGQTSEV